jgi:hypothetical protein
MTEHELLAAKLENANNISLHVWDPIMSWTEEVSLTGEEQSAIVAALREIERLQDAKRAALKLADERAKEVNGLRAKLSIMEITLKKVEPFLSYGDNAEGKLKQIIRSALSYPDEEGKSK